MLVVLTCSGIVQVEPRVQDCELTVVAAFARLAFGSRPVTMLEPPARLIAPKTGYADDPWPISGTPDVADGVMVPSVVEFVQVAMPYCAPVEVDTLPAPEGVLQVPSPRR